MEKMKTLDEYNKKVEEEYSKPIGAGVLCPFCKTEMIYSLDYEAWRPQKGGPWGVSVHCPKCSLTRYKYLTDIEAAQRGIIMR